MPNANWGLFFFYLTKFHRKNSTNDSDEEKQLADNSPALLPANTHYKTKFQAA